MILESFSSSLSSKNSSLSPYFFICFYILYNLSQFKEFLRETFCHGIQSQWSNVDITDNHGSFRTKQFMGFLHCHGTDDEESGHGEAEALEVLGSYLVLGVFVSRKRLIDECGENLLICQITRNNFNHHSFFKVEFQTRPEVFHVTNLLIKYINLSLGNKTDSLKLTCKQKSNVSVCPRIPATLRPLFPILKINH